MLLRESKIGNRFRALIDKTVTQLGYELVDLEIVNHGQLLRVFIDKLDSIILMIV